MGEETQIYITSGTSKSRLIELSYLSYGITTNTKTYKKVLLDVFISPKNKLL